ncbi:TRIC cation channel family protein, partial [Glaesserella parasuis]|uniref:TRIC cation channel family protein n=1 Tax=Glaesserella parasuis TaxID=738 RepID=UPI003B677016
MSIFKAARFYNNLLLVSDAIGLGIFTVLGIDAGIAHGYSQNIFFIVFLGVLTGVGGGMIRDVIANQVPMIFRENIYALPC